MKKEELEKLVNDYNLQGYNENTWEKTLDRFYILRIDNENLSILFDILRTEKNRCVLAYYVNDNLICQGKTLTQAEKVIKKVIKQKIKDFKKQIKEYQNEIKNILKDKILGIISYPSLIENQEKIIEREKYIIYLEKILWKINN